MEWWQHLVLLFYLLAGIFALVKGYIECKYKNNAYGSTSWLFIIGSFVWGDAIVFGIFWIICVVTAFFWADWYLFLLLVSVFWVVRSLGETIYWLNQQFSTAKRNQPEKMAFYSVFRNDSIWYVYQIFWQCAAVFFNYLHDLFLATVAALKIILIWLAG